MKLEIRQNSFSTNSIDMKAYYQKVLLLDQAYAMVILNLKNFRYFNTKYGEKQGNEILILIEDRIQSYLHENEVSCRLYADNFIILFQYDDFDVFIERIISLVDHLYRINDTRIYRELFFSYGIFKLDDSSICFEDACNFANLARRSCLNINQRDSSIEVYNQQIYNNYMERYALEIRTANAYKNYEFTTFLQPKVDTRTKKIVGAEALLRWYGDDGNFVPLYSFLPILNDNGYIQLIDLDCLESMCKIMQDRLAKHLPIVPISFNISKTYFYDPNLLNDYISMVNKYGIPKKFIEIELMESISLDDSKHLKEIIQGFHDAGFQCSLDDFGNGYSSFNVLLNAQLDKVKMDRQFFLHNLNGDSRLVIRTIIDLLKSLKMEIIAEGVESKEHVDYLEECGCDIIQGYYFYKPMPVEEFYSRLEAQERTDTVI